jgi:hypothetical protein
VQLQVWCEIGQAASQGAVTRSLPCAGGGIGGGDGRPLPSRFLDAPPGAPVYTLSEWAR